MADPVLTFAPRVAIAEYSDENAGVRYSYRLEARGVDQGHQARALLALSLAIPGQVEHALAQIGAVEEP